MFLTGFLASLVTFIRCNFPPNLTVSFPAVLTCVGIPPSAVRVPGSAGQIVRRTRRLKHAPAVPRSAHETFYFLVCVGIVH